MHEFVVALPFSELEVVVKRPYGTGYPTDPKTLGDYLRRRRMELRLFQKDVAAIVGVSTDIVTLWENNQSDPTAKFVAKIIQFIGELPPIFPDTFAGRVKAYRYRHGLTHAQMGKLVGVDGSTIGAWEAGYLPKPENDSAVKRVLKTI
ncbi:MAG: helix-turn-helix domain-containing protein [Bacteroidetes bacterium]|nr:helix-turn-helix domain-containing protein [Bacteroidota bacterium]